MKAITLFRYMNITVLIFSKLITNAYFIYERRKLGKSHKYNKIFILQ